MQIIYPFYRNIRSPEHQHTLYKFFQRQIGLYFIQTYRNKTFTLNKTFTSKCSLNNNSIKRHTTSFQYSLLQKERQTNPQLVHTQIYLKLGTFDALQLLARQAYT